MDNASTPFDDAVTPCVPDPNDFMVRGVRCDGPPLAFDAGSGAFVPTTLENADPVFYVTNTLGALVTVTTVLGRTPQECDPAAPGGGGMNPATGIPFAGFDGVESVCTRARGLNAQGQNFFRATVDIAPGGVPAASPANALEHQPVDQQLFAELCSATLPPVDALDDDPALHPDSGLCPLSAFNAQVPLNEQLFPVPLSEVLTVILAGDPNGLSGGPRFLQLASDDLRDLPGPADPFFVVPLNRDPGDGVITALDIAINRDGSTPNPPELGSAAYFLPDPEDFLTLDSTLSPAQRFLAGGCGPFAGTRCDSSARAATIGTGAAQGLVPVFFGGLGSQRTDGLDLLWADAGSLLGSIPGIPGASPADPAFAETPYAPGNELLTSDFLPSRQLIGAGTDSAVEIDCASEVRCIPGYDYTQTVPLASFTGSGLWSTTGSLPQPGTIGFPGPSPCPRDPDTGEPQPLPGCRGAREVLGRENALAAGFVTVVFDDGYDTLKDGCVFATTLRPLDPGTGRRVNVSVLGVYPGGGPVDLSACDPDGDLQTGTRRGDFSRILTGNHPSYPVEGAGTLYHPFAGCLPDEDAIAGLPCDARPFLENHPDGDVDFGRDFDTEFLAGRAQVFRNEMAAVSFNLGQLLVASSCAGPGDDIAADRACFDPRTPWAAGRCSWTTPGECRNVRRFLSYTDDRDSDADAILDLVDNCTLAANPTQCDSDGDGLGNHCDGDLNGDGIVQIGDFQIFADGFGLPPGPAGPLH